ncbi:MAG: hypothetical protein QXR96_01880, partial [Candidatus Woesearchaeota archaeon]
MKKSQITIFLIIGLIIFFITLFAYFFYNAYFHKVNYNSDLNLKDIIQNCIYESAKKQMEKTGLNEQNKAIFIELVKEETKKCTNNIFLEIEKINYKINEGEMQINLLLNNETLILDVNYELEISKDNQKFEIKNFIVTLDKSLYVKIPNGQVQKDTILKSTDGKVELKIEKDTEIKDKKGNNVNAISLKINDIKFNGLENNVVKSNLVYEGLPDGATFSKPIKISFKIDKNTLKYDISNYKIGKWSEDYKIWLGLPSTYNNGYLSANINSFSYYSAPIEGNFLKIVKTKPEQKIFQQRYTFNNDCKEGFQKSNKYLIGTEDKEKYFDFLDEKKGISYGFNNYNNFKTTFVDCLNYLPNECLENNDFIIPKKEFKNEKCPNTEENVFDNNNDANEELCIEKNQGVYCSENKVCILKENLCSCESVQEIDETKIGYCD